MNDVGRLIFDANPIQGDPSLLADDEFEALLLLAQSRSGNMDVEQLQRPVEAEKKNRGWLTTAAAFAAVVVAGSAFVLLANAGTESDQDVVGASAPTLPAESTISATRILFVGNSITEWLGGLDEQFSELSASATPPPSVETDKRTSRGMSLKAHWNTRTPEIITDGAYDVVVLQGDIPGDDIASFKENARNLVGTIRDAAARPVLFMAWPYEWADWFTMDEIAQAHSDIAAELGVDVAPVGLAFRQASQERPDMDMLGPDAIHQSTHGAYLAVNVIYMTIFGTEHPVTLVYLPEGITEEEAMFLQRIARETVSEYTGNQTS